MGKKCLAAMLASILVLSMLLAGCGGGNTAKEAAGSPKDVLIFAQGSDPRTLDPAYTDDSESSKSLSRFMKVLSVINQAEQRLNPPWPLNGA